MEENKLYIFVKTNDSQYEHYIANAIEYMAKSKKLWRDKFVDHGTKDIICMLVTTMYNSVNNIQKTKTDFEKIILTACISIEDLWSQEDHNGEAYLCKIPEPGERIEVWNI